MWVPYRSLFSCNNCYCYSQYTAFLFWPYAREIKIGSVDDSKPESWILAVIAHLYSPCWIGARRHGKGPCPHDLPRFSGNEVGVHETTTWYEPISMPKPKDKKDPPAKTRTPSHPPTPTTSRKTPPQKHQNTPPPCPKTPANSQFAAEKEKRTHQPPVSPPKPQSAARNTTSALAERDRIRRESPSRQT